MQNILCTNLCVMLALGSGCARTPDSSDAQTRVSKSAAPVAAPMGTAATPDPGPPADADKSRSGLISKMLKAGQGEQRPSALDRVRVDFSAWNASGKLVDGSNKRGGPSTFEVSGVIAGWSEALQSMRVGERRRLWIPDELVYPGRPGFPRAMAVFEVELLEILARPAPLPAPPDLAVPPAGAIKTRSGHAYKVLAKGPVVGNGKPRAWDRVTLHHTAWTRDGVMLDSSHMRERPSTFDMATVIAGWREALQRMSTGDRVRLWVPEPPVQGGRRAGAQGPRVFDLELVETERRPRPPRAPAHVAAPPRGATQTRSGLAYRILRGGAGERSPGPTDRVEVHYSAWTPQGELVDSSVVRGQPAVVPISRLIPGWAEGLQQMAEGDRAVLWIPESLAYAGAVGSPKGPLVYDVQLLKIVP